METTTIMQVLQRTIGNPISRSILNKFSCHCETCKKSRIEVSLELYSGIRKDSCIKCKIAE